MKAVVGGQKATCLAQEAALFIGALTALILIVSLAGCIVVPVRTPTVIRNPAGKKGSLPVGALVPGQTTREQVEAQYKGLAVDSGVPSLFWARFRKSSWVLVGGMGGYVGGGAERWWSAYNLLATFDANGNLETFETAPENKLLEKLVTMQRTHQLPVIDLSQPILVNGETSYPRGDTINFQLAANEVVITKSSIVYRVNPKKPLSPPKVATIPIAQVIAVRIGARDVEQVSEIALEMHFSAKTIFGKKIFFTAKPDAALTLVRWLEQEKSRK